jgi:hypothetical protein
MSVLKGQLILILGPRTKRIEVVSSSRGTEKDTGSSLSTPAPSLPAIGLRMTTSNTFASNKKSLKIDPVTFNKLTTGCLVLAYVLKVDTDRLIVSLPGSATVIVLHHEISEVLHRMHLNKV